LTDDIKRIRTVADYQFGKGMGKRLFPDGVRIEYSKGTGRIRYVYLDDKRLVTMRPTNGLFSLGLAGAERIADNVDRSKYLVCVRDDVSEVIAEGGDVFAVHVVKVDDAVRAKDEVVVINESGRVLAVGRAALSGVEMLAFKSGVAVKVRHGVKEES
jgi:uncharacterized protein with predicted RNA binding PUA domain